MSTPKKPAPATEEQQATAAMAALELASPSEVASVPKRLVAEMREASWLLAEGLAPVEPAPSLKSRLLARVAQYEQLRPLADVRRNEDHWIPGGMPGVDIKPLFKAEGRSTYLLRMQPGARIPPHFHHDTEQCLVLEGDIGWGDLVYEVGDFIVMGKGTEHPEIRTVHGNILLLISGHNEFRTA